MLIWRWPDMTAAGVSPIVLRFIIRGRLSQLAVLRYPADL